MTQDAIDAKKLIHSRDAILTENIFQNRAMRGVTGVLSTAITGFSNSIHNVDYVKVSNKNFPEIFCIVNEIAEKSRVALPPTYVTNSGDANACAFGDLDKSFILINSGLLDRLTTEELKFVIGHEMGHIAYGHAPINTILNMCLSTTSLFSSFILGPAWAALQVAGKVLSLTLKQWGQYAELSCDRFGYAACDNIDASQSALLKLALGTVKNSNVDVEAYIEQHAEARKSIVSRLYSLKTQLLETHPSIVHRLIALAMYEKNEKSNQLTKSELDNKISVAMSMPHVINSAEEKFEEIALKSALHIASIDNSIGGKENQVIESFCEKYCVSEFLKSKISQFIENGCASEEIDFQFCMTKDQIEVYMEIMLNIAAADKKYTEREDATLVKLMDNFKLDDRDISTVRNKLLKKYGISRTH